VPLSSLSHSISPQSRCAELLWETTTANAKIYPQALQKDGSTELAGAKRWGVKCKSQKGVMGCCGRTRG